MSEVLKQLENSVDEKLTVAEVYANRPKKWLLYTAIVLIIAVLGGWSSSGVNFNGVTQVGAEVAKGVFYGIFNPDRALLFGTKDTDVPYLLLQTMAIAVLGTIFGAILAIPFAFLASFASFMPLVSLPFILFSRYSRLAICLTFSDDDEMLAVKLVKFSTPSAICLSVIRICSLDAES